MNYKLLARRAAVGALVTWLSSTNPGFGQDTPIVSKSFEEIKLSGSLGDVVESQGTAAVVYPADLSASAGVDQASEEVQDQTDTAAAAAKAQADLQKKIGSAYKPLFFDNDFSYLCDESLCEFWLGDRLKQNSPFGIGCLEVGGQFRARAHFEQNMRQGLTGVDDQFLLYRTRLYADWQLTDNIRVYGEMIDAESNYENFPPRPIDVNRTDLLNGFVDARLLGGGDRTLSLRVGRQELLYGAQRVVSPLDWANTRRTFDGAKVMWKGPVWDVDAFWTHPVFPDPYVFDSSNRDQEFMGFWSTYKAAQDQTTELYYLRYLNGSGANDFKYDTIGARWQGSRCNMLWDVQGAVQMGENTDGSDHGAGMATLGLGRKFPCARWQPTAWLYYDYASGDGDLGAGNGYHHLFPLAHKYFGFMDFFGRRNIEDLNILVTAQPTKRLQLLAWYHYMFLATQSDSPYSVVMTPINGGGAPGSTVLGQELDLLATWTITPRQKLVLGYSHFFTGAYFDTTPGITYNGDADFYYTQWHINF